jgi:hypothetical protein
VSADKPTQHQHQVFMIAVVLQDGDGVLQLSCLTGSLTSVVVWDAAHLYGLLLVLTQL